jgi:hypothetical protein
VSGAPQAAVARAIKMTDTEPVQNSQLFQDALNGVPGVAIELSFTVYHNIDVCYVVNIDKIVNRCNRPAEESVPTA